MTEVNDKYCTTKRAVEQLKRAVITAT